MDRKGLSCPGGSDVDHKYVKMFCDTTQCGPLPKKHRNIYMRILYLDYDQYRIFDIVVIGLGKRGRGRKLGSGRDRALRPDSRTGPSGEG